MQSAAVRAAKATAAEALTLTNDRPDADYCIIHRWGKVTNKAGVNETGWARCGKLDLSLFGDDDDMVDDQIQVEFGHGSFRIDYRINGARGTQRQRTLNIAEPYRVNPNTLGPIRETSAPPAAAAQPGENVLLTLVTALISAQSNMLVAMVGKPNDGVTAKDLIGLAQQRTPAQELQGIAQLGRDLVGDAASGAAGGGGAATMWESIAAGVTQKLMESDLFKPAPPAPRHVANTAAIPSPRVPAQPNAGQSPASAPKMPATANDASVAPLEKFINLVTASESSQERDPEAYATILCDLLSDEVVANTLLMQTDEQIIGVLMAQRPELAPQKEFLTDVIEAARRLLLPDAGVGPTADTAEVDGIGCEPNEGTPSTPESTAEANGPQV